LRDKENRGPDFSMCPVDPLGLEILQSQVRDDLPMLALVFEPLPRHEEGMGVDRATVRTKRVASWSSSIPPVGRLRTNAFSKSSCQIPNRGAAKSAASAPVADAVADYRASPGFCDQASRRAPEGCRHGTAVIWVLRSNVSQTRRLSSQCRDADRQNRRFH